MTMRKFPGLVETPIYTTDGYVAVAQPGAEGEERVCLISVDQLPDVIRELEALYEKRSTWAELATE
jgi:hypothetical protein